MEGPDHPHEQQGHTRSTVLRASLANLTLSAPLLCATGLTLLSTVTLLMISSPLLLIFSPIIISSALVLSASMAGFAASAAMAFAGLSAMGWVVRCARGRGEGEEYEERVVEMVTEAGHRVREKVGKVGGYVWKEVHVEAPHHRINTD